MRQVRLPLVPRMRDGGGGGAAPRAYVQWPPRTLAVPRSPPHCGPCSDAPRPSHQSAPRAPAAEQQPGTDPSAAVKMS